MEAVARTATAAELAREAIRRLATSREAPTPENFARAYREASVGVHGEASSGARGETTMVRLDDSSTSLTSSIPSENNVGPEQVLTKLALDISARCPEVTGAQRLQEHVKCRAWGKALTAANEVVGEIVGATLAELAREWPRLLQQLLNQLDTTHYPRRLDPRAQAGCGAACPDQFKRQRPHP